MKLGMLTACLPETDLATIAAWAEGKFETLEVATWPKTGGRAFEAAHLPVADMTGAVVDDTLTLLDKHSLSISALAYYENNLHPDQAQRTAFHDHLKATVDAAAALGVELVGTFVGRDWTKSVSDNLDEAQRVLPPLVDYAGERGIKLIVENCPMEGWHPDGYPGNLAYSPELWEWMFGLGFYLNWDPSHLTWLGIDPLNTIAPYIDKIAHVQAKDIEEVPGAIDHYGFFGKTMNRSDPWDLGWWRYRVPGRGTVDWNSIIDRLYELGYDGAVSVEHEDPIWSGSTAKVQQGLVIARDTLRPLIFS